MTLRIMHVNGKARDFFKCKGGRDHRAVADTVSPADKLFKLKGLDRAFIGRGLSDP